jgi:hypothetical protein
MLSCTFGHSESSALCPVPWYDDGAHLSDEELWEDIHDVMGAGHKVELTLNILFNMGSISPRFTLIVSN